MNRGIINSAYRAAKGIFNALPLLLGVTLLISIVITLVPTNTLISFFGKDMFLNTLIGAVLGSILAGNPINSYVIAGELISFNIGIIAVTAFLISWVTVGIVQLPAEIMILGKKFAIKRNLLSFVFSIIIAVLIYLILFLGGLI